MKKSSGGQPRSPAGHSSYTLTVNLTPVEKKRLDEASAISAYSGWGAMSKIVRDVMLSSAGVISEGN